MVLNPKGAAESAREFVKIQLAVPCPGVSEVWGVVPKFMSQVPS